MRTSTTRLAAVLAAGALTLAACGGGDEEDGVTIGIKIDQPGLGLQEGDTYTGFDVDVATAVAAELGYEEDQITWTEAPTPQREDLLVNGTVDMIFATYSITPERQERVQFAGPYLVAGQDLLVASGSDITGPDALGDAVVCSAVGSTPADRIAEEYGVTPQTYDTYSLCMEGLASGAVDAVTTDDVILAGYASEDAYAGQFEVVGAPFSEELYGVGLPQDSEQCEEINEIINGLYEDGTMDTIIEENFGDAGYTPAEAPEAGGYCAD